LDPTRSDKIDKNGGKEKKSYKKRGEKKKWQKSRARTMSLRVKEIKEMTEKKKSFGESHKKGTKNLKTGWM